MINFRESERANLERMPQERRDCLKNANRFIDALYEITTGTINVADGDSTLLTAQLLLILADSIRRFRGIVGLCEIGQLENAEILTRSLFESLLAERFILRRRPRKYNLPKQKPQHHARHFRAMLYRAAVAIKRNKSIQQIQSTQGMKRRLPKTLRNSFLTAATNAEKEIGTAWAQRIRNSNSFSGLNIRELAVHCGVQSIYVGLYGELSRVVHGGDAGRHFGNSKTDAATSTARMNTLLGVTLGIAAWIARTIVDDLKRYHQRDPKQLAPTFVSLQLSCAKLLSSEEFLDSGSPSDAGGSGRSGAEGEARLPRGVALPRSGSTR